MNTVRMSRPEMKKSCPVSPRTLSILLASVERLGWIDSAPLFWKEYRPCPIREI